MCCSLSVSAPAVRGPGLRGTYIVDLHHMRQSILMNLIVGLSVCLFVCLFFPSNLLRLKSERHETRHVGPLGTPDGFRPNGFLNFDLKV